MTQHTTVVEVSHLKALYDDEVILEDINFSVHDSEILMIVGPSGCGKSTLLNHLIGLKKPAEGSIFIQQQDLVKADNATRNNILKNIGVTYQSGALFGSLTLLENVRLPLEEWTSLPFDMLDKVALHKLSMVGLENYANYYPVELSGGMQKRAAISRALALDPSILFLDEPGAGLDPITSANLDLLISTLAKKFGITFVIVSHELRSIYNIADRVIILKDKRIAGNDTPGNLRKSKDEYIYRFFNPKVVLEQEDSHDDQ